MQTLVWREISNFTKHRGISTGPVKFMSVQLMNVHVNCFEMQNMSPRDANVVETCTLKFCRQSKLMQSAPDFIFFSYACFKIADVIKMLLNYY